MREDPRIAEQQFGNLQDLEEMRESKRARDAFGKFFFRFPYGESALDVYSRVTSFIRRSSATSSTCATPR